MTRALAPFAAVTLTVTSLATLAGMPAAQARPDGSDLVVSEVFGGGGNSGAPYQNDFVEVHNPTTATVPLTGYAVGYFSSGGTSGGAPVALSGQIPAGGTYLVQMAAGTGSAPALPKPDATGTLAMSGTNGRIDLTKGGALVDRVGYGTANLFEGTAAAPGLSNTTSASRTPTPGTDTDRNNVDFVAGAPTPTACGAACVEEEPEPDPTGVCADPATAIHDIQGAGAAFDPAFGGTRTVEGVVTAAMLGGYFVQEEPSDVDADPQTSEGIFVFQSGAAPAVGNVVRVTGTVTEFDGKTQLGSVSARLDCGASTATVTPVAVTFPLASTNLEHLEGMRVALPEKLVISEYFNYDRFGEVVLAEPRPGEDRLMTPTAVADPGPAAQALLADNERRQIIVDDLNRSQNPSVIPHPGNGRPFALDNRFRGGDTITGLEGIVDDAFGAYRVQPTVYGGYASVNQRPEARPNVGGDVQVASFNVLNYFLTIDRGGSANFVCGPDQDQECRGADDENERKRQRDKIVAAIAGLDADVVGLMEMENTPGVEPAADLAAGLNDKLGAGTYDYIDTGVIGGDAIRLGFLYKPGAVTPAGAYDVFDSGDDPRFDDTRNRPMLTQTFDTVVAAGAKAERFTVSVNHLKSKGSACAGDPDTGDGQGNCNQTRTAAAEAIADHLASDPTGSGDPDHLLIGDMNSYDHEDPIRAFEAAGYQDQVKRFGGEDAYSYVFDGMVGYLDHGLASSSLAGQVTGAQEWHINADEPDVLDYETTFKPAAVDAIYAPDQFRASDHDPVLVGLELVSTDLTARIEPVKPKVGVPATVVVDVTRTDGATPTDGTLTVTREGEVVGTAAVTGGRVRVPVEAFPRKGFYELVVGYTDGSSQDASTTLVVNAVGKP
ncbi:ExeM/NucH family extracellular endonuclease [Nocardioides iriomotensis]|uniref:ExeM/NucH family extracellular endonuclease n=1 Tax=Nocardioides iriomotensis TaxID=715784 RepID=A0A4Q5J1K4_9ACTN|nr:ExeM/NucH family extracellular endonuclease [Nocardioides iriomotensis]